MQLHLSLHFLSSKFNLFIFFFNQPINGFDSCGFVRLKKLLPDVGVKICSRCHTGNWVYATILIFLVPTIVNVNWTEETLGDFLGYFFGYVLLAVDSHLQRRCLCEDLVLHCHLASIPVTSFSIYTNSISN